jgi:hypothetical protein
MAGNGLICLKARVPTNAKDSGAGTIPPGVARTQELQ